MELFSLSFPFGESKVPVFEREARVKCSSQSIVHSSIDFRVIFLQYDEGAIRVILLVI